ncbi:NAC transcription factor NAM-B1-like [Oryza brachyantha]|uniref:NAC domain-containing protein n=1 Tax=Oryza brachyantha TaxID=4533 RepID=J3N8K9_ORYBR|nr:NAC transcription factor NAM-B1-like [Oryza brachyantha]
MAGPGVCIPLVNGRTMHLPLGCAFRPTEGELVVNYLYRRAIQVPLASHFITDVDIMRHNPWDIVPAEEKVTGKHFFTRKERKRPGDSRSNRAAGDGFWRSTGPEAAVYHNPGDSGGEVLVGMKRTLVFHYGKSSSSAESTEWAMQEFRLAGCCLLPGHVTGPATGDSSNPSCISTQVTIAMKNDGQDLSAAHTHDTPLGKTMVVEPDSSWLICRIYKKRQRAPHVIIPPSIGDAREVVLALPAIVNAGRGRFRYVDFPGQPSFEEGTDESPDVHDDKAADGPGKN